MKNGRNKSSTGRVTFGCYTLFINRCLACNWVSWNEKKRNLDLLIIHKADNALMDNQEFTVHVLLEVVH